jgi:hypothetical protein
MASSILVAYGFANRESDGITTNKTRPLSSQENEIL